MNVYKAHLILHATVTGFDAVRSRMEKPSGVSFIILTMLNSGLMSRYTWGEMLTEFEIPVELLPLFRDEIDSMMENGMLISSNEIIDEKCRVSSVKMTSRGREIFEKKVIAASPENFNGSVVYAPAFGTRKYVPYDDFRLSLNNGNSTDVDAIPDEDSIKYAIQSNKRSFGVNDDEDVYDIRLSNPESKVYSMDVKVNFNEVTGRFDIEDSTGLDLSYLKSSHDAESIVYSLGENIFEKMRNGHSVHVWNDIFDRVLENYRFRLPCEIKLDDSLCFYNPSVCEIESGVPIQSGEYDVVSKTDGGFLGYRFVHTKLGVNGFEGNPSRNVVLEYPIEDQDARSMVADYIGASDISTMDGFNHALSVASRADFSDVCLDVIRRRLLSTNELTQTLVDIKKYRTRRWYSDVSKMLEDVMCERNNLVSDCEAIYYAGFKIDGCVLASNNVTDDVRIIDAMCMIASPRSVLDTMEQNESIARMILNREVPESTKSEFFDIIRNASNNLFALRGFLGMNSLSDYHYNIDGLDPKVRKEISERSKTYSGSISKIRSIIRNAPSSMELEKYEKVFSNISSALDGKKINKDPSDLEFGIKIGIMIDKMLSERVEGSDLSDRITAAYNESLISSNEYETLDSIRRFRNTVAHEFDVPPLSSQKRKGWIQFVKRLEDKLKDD